MIAVIVFLLAHAVSSALGLHAAWGIDQLSYLPRWLTAIVVAIAGFAAITPRLLGAVGDGPVPAVELRTGRDQPLWPELLGATLICGAAFLLLRAKTALLGDGLTYLAQLRLSDQSGIAQVEHEPAAFRLVRMLYRLLPEGPLRAAHAYVGLAATSGVVYGAVGMLFARLIAGDRITRILVWCFLMAQGYIALFCGYVETYSVVVTAVLSYMVVATAVLKGKVPYLLAPLALGIGLTLHYSLVALLPSLVALGVLSWRGSTMPGGRSACRPGGQPHGPRVPVRGLARGGGGVVVALCVAAAALSAMHQRPQGLGGLLRADNLLPILPGAGDDFRRAYGVVSPSHVWDLANQVLLVAPAIVMLWLAGLLRGLRATAGFWFYAIACGGPLAMLVLINPEIGAFRDWDLLSWPAVPAVVWASLVVARRL